MDVDFNAASEAIIGFARRHQDWLPLIVFVLAFGESLAFISLVLPFFAILVGIGALVGATGTLQFWIVLAAAAVGAALGDWLSYWLGKYYHKQIGAMWPLRNYPGLLPSGERFFHKWGAWAVVLGRFSGPLRASVPIVAGAVRMPQGKFQLANWSSAFLWAAVLLTLGGSLGEIVRWTMQSLGRG
jgi:membrane protein DedA with SNARE-associated domain